MPNITLTLPEEVYQFVKSHREIRWSEIARRAIEQYKKKLEYLDDIFSESELTEDDALSIGEEVKKSIHKKRLEKNE
jgi:cation transport regulator ChaB